MKEKQHQGFPFFTEKLAQAVKVLYVNQQYKAISPHRCFILQSQLNFCCIIQNYSQVELRLISETAAVL